MKKVNNIIWGFSILFVFISSIGSLILDLIGVSKVLFSVGNYVLYCILFLLLLCYNKRIVTIALCILSICKICYLLYYHKRYFDYNSLHYHNDFFETLTFLRLNHLFDNPILYFTLIVLIWSTSLYLAISKMLQFK